MDVFVGISPFFPINMLVLITSARKIGLVLLFLYIAIGASAQEFTSIQGKWKHWEQHPMYSFYQVVPDTMSSMPDVVLLKTRGDWKGMLGISYPMFHIGKDSLKIDVRIKYKTKSCKNLMLTFCSIGFDTNVVKADTIVLPLEENWTECTYSLQTRCLFSLEVSIEAEGWNPEMSGVISIANLDIHSDGHPLDKEVIGFQTKQIRPSFVKTWEDLLSSPLMEKKILALGETIHGTKALNYIALELMKERIIHYGCKLVVFELPLSVTFYMNRYIKNDPRYSLEKISKFCESFCLFNAISFLQWLKEYNASHNDEITLLGVDGEAYSIPGRMNLYNYLESANVNGKLDSLCYDVIFNKDSMHMDTCVTKRIFSEKESALLQRCINNMKEYPTSRVQFLHRDEKMAEMMQVLCDMYLDSMGKATFYGHFMHANYVMTSSQSFMHNSPSMGYFLKKKYKDDYSCLTLSVKQGDSWFQTMKNEFELHPMQDAPEGSLEESLGSKMDCFVSYLPMENLDAHDIYMMRYASAFYSPNQFSYLIPKTCMDGVVNVDRASHIEINHESIKKREEYLYTSWFETMSKLNKKMKK